MLLSGIELGVGLRQNQRSEDDWTLGPEFALKRTSLSIASLPDTHKPNLQNPTLSHESTRLLHPREEETGLVPQHVGQHGPGEQLDAAGKLRSTTDHVRVELANGGNHSTRQRCLPTHNSNRVSPIEHTTPSGVHSAALSRSQRDQADGASTPKVTPF